MSHSKRAALAVILAGAAIAVTGCTSNDLPIGDDQSLEALLVAGWSGYVENFHFRSGSDVVRIDITSVQGSTIEGTMRVGNGPTLPPASNPDVGYPTNVLEAPTFFGGYDFNLPFEGFEFAIHDAELTDHRLRFSIAPKELWKGWCELQASSPGSGSYECVRNGGAWEETSEGCFAGGQPVDCGYLALCESGVCGCREPGCAAARDVPAFDLLVDQQRADGSIAFESTTYNVRLTRDP